MEPATAELPPILQGAPEGVAFRKLRKRLVAQVREALETYAMVRPGDRWLVCLSGGKNSCNQSVSRMHQSPH